MPKEQAHTGQGSHHLAITVLLINNKNQILLQKRKHLRFDGIWDLTGATDIYHLPQGNETFEQATKRCLKGEYNLENIPIQKVGEFNYFASDGKYSENEHCAILIGQYNGPINPNLEVAYEVKWTDKQQFIQDITTNPDNYSPWAQASIKFINNI